MFTVRNAGPDEAETISELWGAYLREAYGLDNAMTPEVLRRHAFGDAPLFHLVVATGSDARLWGCAAWDMTYDLHHACRGVLVHDLYVSPRYRGFGVAPALLAFAAHHGARRGAAFLRGHVGEGDHSGRRLYDRVSVYFPGAVANVGGRAFLHLAGLAGRSPREIARSLPEPSWNHEQAG